MARCIWASAGQKGLRVQENQHLCSSDLPTQSSKALEFGMKTYQLKLKVQVPVEKQL